MGLQVLCAATIEDFDVIFQTLVKCFNNYSYIHNVNGPYLKETLQSSLKSVCHLPQSKGVKRPANGFSVLTKKHISVSFFMCQHLIQ